MTKFKQRLNNYAKEIINNYYQYNKKTKEIDFEIENVDIDDMIRLAGYMHQAKGEEIDDLIEIFEIDYANLSHSFSTLLTKKDNESCSFETELKLSALAHYSEDLKELLDNKFHEFIEESNERMNSENWDEEGILI